MQEVLYFILFMNPEVTKYSMIWDIYKLSADSVDQRIVSKGYETWEEVLSEFSPKYSRINDMYQRDVGIIEDAEYERRLNNFNYKTGKWKEQ